ncbi:MAG: hypothetical protein RIT27_1638 [Pseudomonadota bacterium]|jgi:hypothetical protein
MTTLINRPVNCLFYSHVWAIHMLKHAGISSFEKQVLIELAVSSNLAPVFGEQGKARYGLAGLLRLAGKLEQFVQTFKYVPAPLILAPRPEISAPALCSAVNLLPITTSDFQSVTLLVHIDDAPLFLSAYQAVSKFSILWDLADAPTPALVQLAELLTTHAFLTKETWAGFHLYKHPNRPIVDADNRRDLFQQTFQDFPDLAV